MTDKTNKPRCCAMVHDTFGVGFHRCVRAGVIERNGKLYCRQHDPQAIAERDAKRNAEWDAEREATRRRIERQRIDAAKAAMFDELVEMLAKCVYEPKSCAHDAATLVERARKIGEPK